MELKEALQRENDAKTFEELSRARIELINALFESAEPFEIDGEIHVIISQDIEPVYRTIRYKHKTDKGLLLQEIAMFDFNEKIDT